MRNAVIETVYQEAIVNPNVYFITGDFQHVREKEFKALGVRYQNAGMAEQNILGMASGIALSGGKVFVYSIIPFITLRCIEQIKVDVCSHNCDVAIVGGGAGFTYGTCGITHLAIEDIAIMRALPNMKIVSPSGPKEVVALMREIIKIGGPTYIRLDKRGEKDLVDQLPEFGRGMIVREGKDVCVVATGTILAEALIAADILGQEEISVEIINMHTIKPLDVELIKDRIGKREAIFTLEEHNVISGLGSAVAEVIAESNQAVKFHRFGIEDSWPRVVGDQIFLRKYVGLSGKDIALKIKTFL